MFYLSSFIASLSYYYLNVYCNNTFFQGIFLFSDVSYEMKRMKKNEFFLGYYYYVVLLSYLGSICINHVLYFLVHTLLQIYLESIFSFQIIMSIVVVNNLRICIKKGNLVTVQPLLLITRFLLITLLFIKNKSFFSTFLFDIVFFYLAIRNNYFIKQLDQEYDNFLLDKIEVQKNEALENYLKKYPNSFLRDWKNIF